MIALVLVGLLHLAPATDVATTLRALQASAQTLKLPAKDMTLVKKYVARALSDLKTAPTQQYGGIGREVLNKLGREMTSPGYETLYPYISIARQAIGPPQDDQP